MLKKLFVTAAAAAAVSVPLAGAAWADKPADPGANGNGIGQGGIPDRAAGSVADNSASSGPIHGNERILPASQSGNSGVVAPGSAYSTGAKVPGPNTPDGYGVFLNPFWDPLGSTGLVTSRTPLLIPSIPVSFPTPFQGRSRRISRMGARSIQAESASSRRLNFGIKKGDLCRPHPVSGVRAVPISRSILKVDRQFG